METARNRRSNTQSFTENPLNIWRTRDVGNWNRSPRVFSSGSEWRNEATVRLPWSESYPLFLSEGHDRWLHEAGLRIWRTLSALSDTEKEVIQAYDVRKEKKNDGKVSMGVVRTTYLIDGDGIIVKGFDKVKAADNPAQMLAEIS